MESKQGHRSKFWTILILSPSGFFDERIRSFPVQEIGFGQSQALGHCFGRLSRLGAEMNLIGNGLERISERWASFQGYFDFILDSGDSLMKPSEHDNLLFDDGAFSRCGNIFGRLNVLRNSTTASPTTCCNGICTRQLGCPLPSTLSRDLTRSNSPLSRGSTQCCRFSATPSGKSCRPSKP